MSATIVTLLNASYESHGRVSFEHAIRLLNRKAAEVVEHFEGRMAGPWPWPKVIRLVRYVSRAWIHRPAGWSRRGVLVRDRHRCAYCGSHAATLDHIVPRSRGGEWSWLNVVAACGRCNERKRDRTPLEAGMPLLARPYHPTRAQLDALEEGHPDAGAPALLR